MFIAIAVNVIATPMVIEVAETPQQLADALVEWCVDEMGEPKPVNDTFHKEVIEACNAGFRDFTHVREAGLPALKMPFDHSVIIVIQRYDEEEN